MNKPFPMTDARQVLVGHSQDLVVESHEDVQELIDLTQEQLEMLFEIMRKERPDYVENKREVEERIRRLERMLGTEPHDSCLNWVGR